MFSAPRIFSFVSFVVLSSAIALAQTGHPSGGGSTGGGGATKGPTAPTPTPTVTTTTPGRTVPPLQRTPQAPIILTGNVVMDDGTPPSERIAIERVCNGRVLKEGYTDSKGYFNITIGGILENSVMQDASVEGPYDNGQPGFAGMGMSRMGPLGSQNSMPLFGCQLRAASPGTLSDVIELSDKRGMDEPNVGTIVLHRIGKVDGATVSVTSLQAPKEAKKAFDSGRKDLKKKHPDKAEQAFAHAVEIYPNYAEAWAELAGIYLGDKQYDKAESASQKALAADPHFVNPYFTLISVAAHKQDWKATEAYSDKLLSLDAYHYPAAYFYDALATYQLHQLDKALKSIVQAKKYDVQKSLPRISLLMGDILVQNRDFAGAVQAYKEFLEREPQGPAADFARKAMNDAQTRVAAAGPTPAAPKN